MIALLVALAMAATQPAAAPYRVVGADAPWSLTIARGRIRFEPAGARAIEVRAPHPTTTEISREYRTDRLRVHVFPGSSCTDSRTGRRHADTVFVQVGAEELRGCGGAPLGADDLNDTSWQFVEIGGAAVQPDMAGYSLDLQEGSFLGYSRCNRFTGRYTQADGILTFSWLGSTMTRCRPPHDAHELHLRRIFSGRAGLVRFSLPDPQTLVLTADVTIRLRRVDTGD